MSKVERKEILNILNEYDKENLTIATLGSHTSLHILKGAKEEGFHTAIICEKGREIPYQRFKVADEYIIVDNFKMETFCKVFYEGYHTFVDFWFSYVFNRSHR